MISLEQIRALEGRVEKAVVLIRGLRGENDSLALRLADAQTNQAAAESRSAELEARIEIMTRREAESQTALQAAEVRVSSYEARMAAAEARIPEVMTRLAERENRAVALEEKAARAEAKAFELENRAEELRREQVRIEEGIVHALEKLDAFEDLVLGSRTVPSREPDPVSGIAPLAVAAVSSGAGATVEEVRETDMFADAVLALDEALGGGIPSIPDISIRKNAHSHAETVTGLANTDRSDFGDSGEHEEEAVWTPTAPATQEPAFPGAENELDIF